MNAQILAAARTRGAMSSQVARRAMRSRRTYATTPANQANTYNQSHVVAGLAGGVAVLTVGYGFYHFSGAKQVVQTIRTTTNAAKDAKDRLSGSISKAGDFDYGFVKDALKVYAVGVPGAGWIVDRVFDQLDQLRKDHREEIDDLLQNTWHDVKQALAGHKDMGEVFTLFTTKFKDVQALASGMAKSAQGSIQDGLESFVQANPKVKEMLSGSMDQLKSMGESAGLGDVVEQLQGMAKDGMSAENMAKMKELLETKVKEAMDKAGSTGQEIRKKAVQAYSKVLDSNQDLKKAVSSNLEQLNSLATTQVVVDTLQRLTDLSKKGFNKDSIAEAQKILTDELKKAKEAAQKDGQELLKQYPELKKLQNYEQLQDIGADKSKQVYEELKSLLRKNGLNKSSLAEGQKVIEKAIKEAKADLSK